MSYVLIPGNGICLTVPHKDNKRAMRAVCLQTAVVCKQTARVFSYLYRAEKLNKLGFLDIYSGLEMWNGDCPISLVVRTG